MNEEKLIAELAASLAESAIKNTAGIVIDKVKAAKSKRDQQKTIQELEQIINELVDEKLELTRIATAYQQQLGAQLISDAEIAYITDELLPKFRELLQASSNESSQQIDQMIEVFKPLLSKEVLTIGQLIGFNYKRAIGEPLTQLVAGYIDSLSKKKRLGR